MHVVNNLNHTIDMFVTIVFIITSSKPHKPHQYDPQNHFTGIFESCSRISYGFHISYADCDKASNLMQWRLCTVFACLFFVSIQSIRWIRLANVTQILDTNAIIASVRALFICVFNAPTASQMCRNCAKIKCMRMHFVVSNYEFPRWWIIDAALFTAANGTTQIHGTNEMNSLMCRVVWVPMRKLITNAETIMV